MLADSRVARDILVPRYYDPRIADDLAALGAAFALPVLGALVRDKCIAHSHGSYVPKIHYGTGPHPYIRTSDIANWEVKASPKHGVPRHILDQYSPKQDVRVGDILFVHEGTYLIGAVAMVTEYDGPLLYQHHIAKFTVRERCPFNAFYLLAALESPLVHRQVRSKQFSADIIDSVVGRVEELVIPYPRDSKRLRYLEQAAEVAVVGRAELREKIAVVVRELDLWLAAASPDTLHIVLNRPASAARSRESVFLGGRRGYSASTLQASEVRGDVLLPRYYDPWVEATRLQYVERCDVRSIGELVQLGMLELATGDEIGRLNYGTGNIPFVRTSDFGSWELKRESKQGVSEEVYLEWRARQDVRPGDILLVRDGTYLIGTSVLVCDDDLPLLYCGGIYKIRSRDHALLPPGLLFALLNIPFVKRQIRNKQFTRDVIDTLGLRVSELLLPVPRDGDMRIQIGEVLGQFLARRTHLRAELSKLTNEMFDGPFAKALE